jgi:hypothetical protein
MGRGKRQQTKTSDREALAAMGSFLAGGSPLHPLELPFMAAEAEAVLGVDVAQVAADERGSWLYLVGPRERDYTSVGKYMFFSPRPEALVPAGRDALLELDFHHGKISRYRRGYPNHVLCVYWYDDSRLEEMGALAAKHGLEYGGWKTNAETRAQIAKHGYSF